MTDEYFYPTMKGIATATSGESVFSARVSMANAECQYRFVTSVSGDLRLLLIYLNISYYDVTFEYYCTVNHNFM